MGAAAGPRADGLDALRGFAILTMALSGMVPRGVLPAWMYHAQLPPPTHAFNANLPGLTWVDLVFPFFLFAMGAAIPLALTRRLDAGQPLWLTLWGVLRRGILLAFFALYAQHLNPWLIEKQPSQQTWWTVLLGFAALFPALTRLPAAWPVALRVALRVIGWGAAIGMLALLRYPDGSGFKFERGDIILIVLTNVAVFGTLLWLLTRGNPLLQAGLVILLIALRLAHEPAGWVKDAWNWTPAPWVYRLYYLQYLIITIPGMMAGELVQRVLSPSSAASRDAGGATGAVARASRDVVAGPRSLLLAVGLLALQIVVVSGLQARWLLPTTLLAGGCLGICAALLPTGAETGPLARLLRGVFTLGALWLAIGLVLEPYEGGIKKDNSTLSYYFVTAGLATLALLLLTLVCDVFGKRAWLWLLISNGQNPMVAYLAIRALLPPVLALCGLETLLNDWLSGAWLGTLRALLKTLLLALAVSALTRARLIWRA